MNFRWVALLAALAAGFCLTLSSGSAVAAPCSQDRYDHNGSLMLYERCDNGRVTMSYLQPRQGLADQGVRKGTLLFDGTESKGGQISGRMRAFTKGCPALPYPASGGRYKGTIELNGRKPVRDGKCKVTDTKPQSSSFTLIGKGGDKPGNCPPGFHFDKGQCIRNDAGGGNAKDWYVVALEARDQATAQIRAATLGSSWYVMNSSRCPNMMPGSWLAVYGPTDKDDAMRRAAKVSLGGSARKCH